MSIAVGLMIIVAGGILIALFLWNFGLAILRLAIISACGVGAVHFANDGNQVVAIAVFLIGTAVFVAWIFEQQKATQIRKAKEQFWLKQ